MRSWGSQVISCLLVTDITKRFGLRKVVVFAAFLMTVSRPLAVAAERLHLISSRALLSSVLRPAPLCCLAPAPTAAQAGCFLRSGVPLTGVLPPYDFEVAGTVLVGAAQPFFQCTPPLLSATWCAVLAPLPSKPSLCAISTSAHSTTLSLARMRARTRGPHVLFRLSGGFALLSCASKNHARTIINTTHLALFRFGPKERALATAVAINFNQASTSFSAFSPHLPSLCGCLNLSSTLAWSGALATLFS